MRVLLSDKLGAVQGTNSTPGAGVPGTGILIGRLMQGTVENVVTSGQLDGLDRTGGIIGRIDNSATLRYGYNYASVIGEGNGTGGVVGNLVTSTVEYSANYGNIAASLASVGGLVGIATINPIIRYSYSVGNVVNFGSIVASGNGGLVGALTNGGTIENSYATGNVQGQGNVGGLVGNMVNGGTIENSYATGTVHNTNSSSVDGAGGLIGRIGRTDLSDAGDTFTITNSYASGAVSHSNPDGPTGGLIGRRIAGIITINNSYWNIDSTGQATSVGGGVGLTQAQSTLASSYTGWDMATTGGSGALWRLYEGDTMPLLRAFLTPLTINTAGSFSKTYDGISTLNPAAIDSSSIPLVDLDLSQLFTNSNAGTNTMRVYSSQRGYDITQATFGTLTITPRPITISGLTANDKPFDGTTNATFSLSSASLLNTIPGDTVSLNPASLTGFFSNSRVGNWSATLTSASLTGAAAGNYVITNLPYATSGRIFIPNAPTVGVRNGFLQNMFKILPEELTLRMASMFTYPTSWQRLQNLLAQQNYTPPTVLHERDLTLHDELAAYKRR